MTDFHTHVLPMIDDGAKDVEVASKMLFSAKEQGITTVVATSHYYGKSRSPEQFIEGRNNAYELLKDNIPDGLTIKLGAEVYLSERAPIHPESLCKLCIEGTKYLLIELPFVKKWERSLYEKIADLIAETDCIPILAHVDRYAAFLNKPYRLLEFVEMGCLLQINASAFIEKPLKNFAFTLLKKGYVHCIGTDMHDCKHRAPDMLAAYEIIKAQGLTAEWDNVQERMQRMLKGERIENKNLAPIRKIFGKFR